MTSVDSVDLDYYKFSLSEESSHDYIELKRARFEQVLNILGYMPGISSASGTTRVFYGIIAVVAGLAAGLFLGLANRVMHYPQGSYPAMKQLSYAVHGSENIFRGLVELLPFVVNNLALIAYDLTITRHEYDAERRERLSTRHKV